MLGKVIGAVVLVSKPEGVALISPPSLCPIARLPLALGHSMSISPMPCFIIPPSLVLGTNNGVRWAPHPNSANSDLASNEPHTEKVAGLLQNGHWSYLDKAPTPRRAVCSVSGDC